MRKFYIPVFSFFMIICLCACEDVYTICNLSREVNFNAGFYQRIGATDVAVTAPSLTISLLNGSGNIYNNQANTPSFSLPLNPLTDSAKYLISISSSFVPDTLTIVYTSQTTNLSAECGSITYNNVTVFRSTHNTIDSVKLITAAIINSPIQNAKIYF